MRALTKNDRLKAIEIKKRQIKEQLKDLRDYQDLLVKNLCSENKYIPKTDTIKSLKRNRLKIDRLKHWLINKDTVSLNLNIYDVQQGEKLRF